MANARRAPRKSAARRGEAWDIDRLRLLLSFVADVNARNFAGGHTPLYYAANHVDLSRPADGKAVAETLIWHGAEVDVRSGPIRGTPRYTAARRDNVAVGSVLLLAGADLEARDIKGETPLRRALNCRQPGMIELLLAHAANPDSPDKRGVTPRQVAKKRGLLIGGARDLQRAGEGRLLYRPTSRCTRRQLMAFGSCYHPRPPRVSVRRKETYVSNTSSGPDRTQPGS